MACTNTVRFFRMRTLLTLILILTGIASTYGFSEISDEYRLETTADYRALEPQIREAIAWLVTTPLDMEHAPERERTARFFLAWLEGNPDAHISWDEKTAELIGPDRSGHLICIFWAGYTEYALTHQAWDDRVKCTTAGLETVVAFHDRNRELMIDSPTLDHYRTLIADKKLLKFVRKHLK